MRHQSITLLFILFTWELTSCDSQHEETHQFTFRQGVNLAHWTDHLFEGRKYGDPKWFNATDVAWIARQGLDHIQIRVSGVEVTNPDNTLNLQRLSVLDSAIVWCKRENLGTIITLMEFPGFDIDSTLSVADQNNIRLQKQVVFWEALSSYFAGYGPSVRYNIHGRPGTLPKDSVYLNNFIHRVVKAVRKKNPERKIYLPAVSLKKLHQLSIPKEDPNICISADYEDMDIFALQYARPYFFPLDFPHIGFPDTVPDLANLLEKKHWAQAYSRAILDENYLNKDFDKVVSWMQEHAANREFHITAWGYYVGYPFDPKAYEDPKSIENYAKAFYKSSADRNLYWAIYDYNSGMAIRDSLGDPAVLLKALPLKKL